MSCPNTPQKPQKYQPLIYLETPPTTPTKNRTQQPLCPICEKPATLHFVKESNPNGNAGRPYYMCDEHQRWLCWADERGLHPLNPPCDCGAPSRQDRIGVFNLRAPKMGFWTCASGACRFYSEDRDGETGWVAKPFKPWLLSGGGTEIKLEDAELN